MNDLRTAAQQALEALEFFRDTAICSADTEAASEAIAALRAALAQQAEPVESVGAAGLFTLAHLWAQQCYFKGLGRPCDIDSARGAFEQALKAYTAPPQRKPLTDEEIPALAEQVLKLSVYYDVWALLGTDGLVALVRAVERAHGIKERP